MDASFLCAKEIGRNLGALPDTVCKFAINNGGIVHPGGTDGARRILRFCEKR